MRFKVNQVQQSHILRSAHTVVTCFVSISQQIATFALDSVTWLDFVAEMEFVPCAVQTESKYNSGWSTNFNSHA
jgi:hypothetical protein